MPKAGSLTPWGRDRWKNSSPDSPDGQFLRYSMLFSEGPRQDQSPIFLSEWTQLSCSLHTPRAPGATQRCALEASFAMIQSVGTIWTPILQVRMLNRKVKEPAQLSHRAQIG